MGNFLAQLKRSREQAAREAEPKPISSMDEEELSSEIAATKAEILSLQREAVEASREAAAEAKQRPRFLANKRRRKTWG